VVDRSDFSPVVKAEEVIGHSVHNQANESLGKIEDLAIDSNNGRVAYAVLSFGGVLGIGDKLFAVPWSALQRPKSGPYVLDIDKKRLTDEPGFSKDQWPDMSTAAFGQGVYPFYGQTYSEDGARLAGPIVKASELKGLEVRNPKNEKLGKIEELAIAPASGRIRYAVLSNGGNLGMGDKLFAVPWSALKHQAENKTITLDVDKDALKRQQGFDKSSWPNMADPDWVRRNAEPYRTAVPSDRDRD
jgi:sporulation protein YlmC with PRC-barrel domain